MRLSHLLAAAVGAAVAYVVLTFESKKNPPGADEGAEGAHGAFGADGTVGTYDPAAAAEALERRRVRAGRPLEPEREGAAV